MASEHLFRTDTAESESNQYHSRTLVLEEGQQADRATVYTFQGEPGHGQAHTAPWTFLFGLTLPHRVRLLAGSVFGTGDQSWIPAGVFLAGARFAG